ncbi:MAG: hypothetical protein QGH13_00285 [Candidatus Thalassarchaeaceae archaeon]|nr:hypothetical protein [Candidatus Thalassarchaeaceae archaeon]|tara:strand:+ start:2111 stop:2767 length:657 start_codon:yes stop_codon:yes gene_type:complete
MRLDGPVRFRFRDLEADIEVLIEGDASWVDSIRQELGISGEGAGYLVPIHGSFRNSTDQKISGANRSRADSRGGPPQRPGPTPDPSRIPASIRAIGDLDIQGEFDKLGVSLGPIPSSDVLKEELEELAPFEPLEGASTELALEERILQALLEIIVRTHGRPSTAESLLYEVLGDRFGMDTKAFGKWLRRLWKQGRLERVFGSDGKDAYAPFPFWLNRE